MTELTNIHFHCSYNTTYIASKKSASTNIHSTSTYIHPTMSANVLSSRDVNSPMKPKAATSDVKSMEYHRQVLESRMKDDQ